MDLAGRVVEICSEDNVDAVIEAFKKANKRMILHYTPI